MRKTSCTVNDANKANPHAVTGLIIGFHLHELMFTSVLWFYFISVFVFVIDDNDTKADEAYQTCLYPKTKIKVQQFI